MRSYTLEGIIIKRVNVGEADKIITVFTREMGKVSLKAGGIRKLQSKRAGSLELFNHVRIAAVRGRGNLDVLTEVDIQNTFSAWKKQLGRVNVAYQLVEVVDKLTPENQPHPQVFEILYNAFSDIDSLGSDWKLHLEDWLLDILKDLGYWPEDEKFTGDIYKFIEEIISRPLHAPGILKKLSQ
jgi:DNA repair protein RecO (recombination protein O)